MRAAFALLLVACQVKIDYAGTSYACATDEECPSGYACLLEECRRVLPPDGGGGGDAGGTIDGTGGPPRCGDALVNVEGEECDDGNETDTDGCVDCQLAECGDGVIRDAVEDCDDSNTLDGDDCPSSCARCEGLAFDGHCYTTTASGSWSEGQTACEADGGHLATVTTGAEQDALAAWAGQVWIGLHDQFEGFYEWEDGEPYAYTAWGATQPDNGGGLAQEDCVELRGDDVWNDLPCATALEALCEHEGWVVNPADAHAYLILWSTMTFDAAEAACAAYGGHLATVGSEEEQAFLTDAIDVEVGIGLRLTGGTWAWANGEPAGYTNWRTGEPNNMPSGSDCAVMRNEGDWTDKKCDDLRALCEID